MTEPETVTIWGAWVNYQGHVEVASAQATRTAKQVRIQRGGTGGAFGNLTNLPVERASFTRRDALDVLFAKVKRKHDQTARDHAIAGANLTEITRLLAEEGT